VPEILKTEPGKLHLLFPGISPAIGACYAAGGKVASLVIAVAIGLSLGISYIFGTFLYKKFRETTSVERTTFWNSISLKIHGSQEVNLREMITEFREYEKLILDRRNIFWGLFARVTLAIVVVGLIALLVSTCRVESQAGLPIISGIIAFIIGQGSGVVRSENTPVVVSPTGIRAPKPVPSGTAPAA